MSSVLPVGGSVNRPCQPPAPPTGSGPVWHVWDIKSLAFCEICGSPLYDYITREGPGKKCLDSECGAEYAPFPSYSQLRKGALPSAQLSRPSSRAIPIEQRVYGGDKNG